MNQKLYINLHFNFDLTLVCSEEDSVHMNKPCDPSPTSESHPSSRSLPLLVQHNLQRNLQRQLPPLRHLLLNVGSLLFCTTMASPSHLSSSPPPRKMNILSSSFPSPYRRHSLPPETKG
ncbi:hypothetical protein L2E82_25502 [Cichorium intybus]|uniref:Uncharacterized protein n=1 Tax=Cichorium intybus TaxID=13427 RepID=A0ACB9E3D1_CICIN|nr:hypothetical protein L2E82_25502 [Cichorium intybus]